MSKLLLPELPIAHGSTALIQEGSQAGGCPFSPELIKRYGMDSLKRYVYAGMITAQIDLTPLVEEQLTTWDELPQQAHKVVSAQVETNKANIKSSLTPFEKAQAHERLEHDSRAGAAQIAAFLQVIPRVLFRSDFAEPNNDIARRAQLSKGLMVRWSKVDEATDARLVYGVASPKPDINKLDPYEGLRFHTKWFEEKQNGAIGFRAEKLPHIRGEYDQPLSLNRTTNEPIFGCPAVQLVPQLYDAMVVSAQANGLFEATYSLERKNHAY